MYDAHAFQVPMPQQAVIISCARICFCYHHSQFRFIRILHCACKLGVSVLCTSSGVRIDIDAVTYMLDLDVLMTAPCN